MTTLLTSAEVARRLRIDRRTFQRVIVSAQALPRVVLPRVRSPRYRESDVEAYIAANTIRPRR